MKFYVYYRKIFTKNISFLRKNAKFVFVFRKKNYAKERSSQFLLLKHEQKYITPINNTVLIMKKT